MRSEELFREQEEFENIEEKELYASVEYKDYFLYVTARIVPEKGVHSLIQAFVNSKTSKK